jgi:hypothetical protein
MACILEIAWRIRVTAGAASIVARLCNPSEIAAT